MPLVSRLLLAATLALAACGSPFEVELPQTPPRLVLQSLFAADSVFTVAVLQSASPVAVGGAPAAAVETATVEVFEDGAAVGQAVYVPGRRRYVSDVRARAGRTYRVRVTAPGFEPAEAEDTVPRPTPFTVDVISGDTDAGDDARVDALTVRFTSPTDSAFFGLYGLVEQTTEGGPVQRFSLAFRSTDPLLADGNLGGVVFDFEDPYYQRAFFRVVPPVGPDVAIRLNARRAVGAPNVQTRERLRLATLSSTYYAYARALEADADGTVFEAPRALPSNVRGGYGIVAAFAAAEQPLP